MDSIAIMTAFLGSGILALIIKGIFQSGKIINKIEALQKEILQSRSEFLEFKTNEFAQFKKEVKDEFKEIRDEFTSFKKEVKDEFKEIRDEFTSFKKEVKDEFIEFRKEVKDEFKEVKENLSQLKDRVLTIEVQLRSGPYHWEPRIIEKKRRIKYA